MSYMPSQPPMPPAPRMSYGRKIFLLGLQSGVLMFAALIIWIISDSRESLNRNVVNKIAQEWGEDVSISGPVIGVDSDAVGGLRPETFVCDARVETKSLHRNIYEAEVFSAGVTMSGMFRLDSLTSSCDTVFVRLNVPSGQISRLSALSLGGKSIGWRKAGNHLIAAVDIASLPGNLDFSADFDIRGSKSLYINQIGSTSSITIDGQAPNPSFHGSSLPEERNVRGRTFAARWQSDDDQAVGVAHINGYGYVGADFLVGVDRYQKVNRSLKYAFLIILLTYVSVLAAEMIMKRDIPLLNYFLIGAALIIFYSLLLSFSEHVSFGLAYLIAASMTVLLIAGYMWKMLASRKVGLAIGAILAAMYVSCYILLTLTNFALLLGSLILFAALAAMMYASLQIKQ